MDPLKNKVVVLTGGAGWLGQEFAKAIVQGGGHCIIADVHPEGKKIIESLKKEIGDSSLHFIQTNINSISSVESLISNAVEKFGRVDSLINNAYPRNKNYGRKFEEVTLEDFNENINLHLGGYFLMSQRFAEFFANQGEGNIINISSIYGVVPPKFEIYEGVTFTMPVEYAMIKSGLVMLTKYMAKYYKGKNIRVNCISPGGIYNNHDQKFMSSYNRYTLNKGMLDKSDITGTLIFLLSDSSKYINGQNLVVDDGFTL